MWYNTPMSILLTIFPIALIAILLYGARICGINEYNDDYLSLSQTKLIQAAAAIGVILHHVTQDVTVYGSKPMGPITAFAQMGILFTSIFFFSSGYGLLLSFRTRENYLDGFLLHRLPAVIIPFFMANLAYIIFTCISRGRIIETNKMLRYFFGIYLINGNGWYIIEILVLYLAFYILFRFIKKKDVSLFLLIAFSFLLIMWTKNRGHEDPLKGVTSNWFMGEWWYNSTVVFVMGLLFARFKEKITEWIKNHYKTLLIITVPLFIAAFVVEEIARVRLGYYNDYNKFSWMDNETVTCIAQNLLCIVWMFLVILLSLKIKLGNECLKFVSLISTELFLCHGIFVTLFTDEFNVNAFLKYVLVIVCSIPLAYVLARVDKFLTSKTDKLKIPNLAALRAKLQSRSEKIATTKKKRTMILAGIIIGVLVIFVVGRTIYTEAEFKKEVKTISAGKAGDIVTFGRSVTGGLFIKEPLEWIILEAEGGRYLLVTKQGIAGATYNQTHEEISWENSDIRQELSESKYTDMFSKKEKKLIRENECGDMISLLTVSQATELFSDDESRELTVTSAAKAAGVNLNSLSKVNRWDFKEDKTSWWWLRGDDAPIIKAPIVNCDGQIEPEGKYVNKPNGAVRPVIIIEVQ